MQAPKRGVAKYRELAKTEKERKGRERAVQSIEAALEDQARAVSRLNLTGEERITGRSR